MCFKKKKKKVSNCPRSMISNNLLMHDPCFVQVGKDMIRHFLHMEMLHACQSINMVV